ncbi:MAG: hypothetical protein V3U31_00705 [Dehalococcoidia bacterium]
MTRPRRLNGSLRGWRYRGEVAGQEVGLLKAVADLRQKLARLDTELRQAFESARRQHPGKRIRLTWEP